ncbi:WSC domain-containing protein [Apiospora saccharicola]|uniref:WSC domain-containing protein n=1 Tax=Apiospora saccharicola TaxID=335842 RepID=A0ABR1WFJ5_9PEZI
MAAMKTLRMAISLVTLIMLALYSSTAAASDLAIFNGSSKFVYGGCYSETQGLNGSTSRTLKDQSEVKPDDMTVSICLDFCSKYSFAGLEWSRECWCGNEINLRSTKQKDSECDMACPATKNLSCGGNLRLSIYNSTVTSSATSIFSSPTSSHTTSPTSSKNSGAALAASVIWAILFARGMALSLAAL